MEGEEKGKNKGERRTVGFSLEPQRLLHFIQHSGNNLGGEGDFLPRSPCVYLVKPSSCPHTVCKRKRKRMPDLSIAICSLRCKNSLKFLIDPECRQPSEQICISISVGTECMLVAEGKLIFHFQCITHSSL